MDVTALLVLDYQYGTVDQFGTEEALHAAVAAVDAARAHGIQVYFVRTAFRPGLPEIGTGNKIFKKSGEFPMASDHAATIHRDFHRNDTDILVTKRRVSAFSGSDLSMLLRASNTTSLFLAGIATSGAVLSTLREAADLDFELTVLADACVDFDDAVHDALIEKVFPMQADVTTSQQWIESLRQRSLIAPSQAPPE